MESADDCHSERPTAHRIVWGAALKVLRNKRFVARASSRTEASYEPWVDWEDAGVRSTDASSAV